MELFLLKFKNTPNLNKNPGQKEHYFKDLILFDLKAIAFNDKIYFKFLANYASSFTNNI